MYDGIFYLRWSSCAVFSVICAFGDLNNRKIPNRYTYSAALAGFLFAVSIPGIEFFETFVGFLSAGSLFLLLWFPGAVGGGDVKMMAALGALLGWPVIGEVIFWTAIAGGVLAIVVLMFGKIPWIDRYEDPREADVPRRKKSLPYGVAIAIGTYVTFFLTVFG